MTSAPASMPKTSSHPCGDRAHSLPTPGPPASLSLFRLLHDGSNWPQGIACERFFGCGI
jgi:hypothetical protein